MLPLCWSMAIVSNVNCSQLKCFTLTLLICGPAPTMRLWGLHVDLPDSKAHPGASSAQVEESESLVSGMDIEFATSKLSSCDDKEQEELL